MYVANTGRAFLVRDLPCAPETISLHDRGALFFQNIMLSNALFRNFGICAHSYCRTSCLCWNVVQTKTVSCERGPSVGSTLVGLFLERPV